MKLFKKMSAAKYITILNEKIGYEWRIGRNDLPADETSGGFCVYEPHYFLQWMHTNFSWMHRDKPDVGAYVVYADIPEDAQQIKDGDTVKASSVVIYEPLIPFYKFIPHAIKAGADVHAFDNLALHYTVAYGDVEMLKWLLDHGADVQSKNNYALHRAAFYGRLDMVKCLLDHGADVEGVDEYACRCIKQAGYSDVIKCLVDHGVPSYYF